MTIPRECFNVELKKLSVTGSTTITCVQLVLTENFGTTPSKAIILSPDLRTHAEVDEEVSRLIANLKVVAAEAKAKLGRA